MFGLGWMEILLILVLALVVLGPQRAVDAGRWLGKVMREVRQTTEDVGRSFSLEEPPPEPGQRGATPGNTAPEGSQPRQASTPPNPKEPSSPPES